MEVIFLPSKAVEIRCAITSDHRQKLVILCTFGTSGMKQTWCPSTWYPLQLLNLTNLEEETVSLKGASTPESGQASTRFIC